jgi:hypothetical protein
MVYVLPTATLNVPLVPIIVVSFVVPSKTAIASAAGALTL